MGLDKCKRETMSFKDFLSFILQYFGVANTGDTPENKGQCTGLIEVWLDALGLNSPHLFGNAKDLLTNADSSKFDIIINKAGDTSQFPVCGDILVYGDQWGGGYGHTGVVLTADGNSIILFEQNNPAEPIIRREGYNNCLGWLHPKNFSPDQQSIIDDLRTARDNNWTLYQTELTKNGELTTENQGLKTQLAQVNQADADLLSSYKKKFEEDATAIDAGIVAEQQLKRILDQLKVSTTDEAIQSITSLQAPHEELVKNVQPTMDALAEAATYKRVPKSTPWYQPILDWLHI